MSLEIRPLAPADYPRVVEILNTVNNDPISLQSFIYDLETWNPAYPAQRLVATWNGEVVASGSALRAAWMKPTDGMVDIVVDPAHRGHGIGRALYQTLVPFWQLHPVERVVTMVRDNDPASLAWAERRRFLKRHHIFDSYMNPADFDEADFPGVVDGLLAQGYRFVQYASIRTPEADRQLFDLHQRLLKDLPNAEDLGPGDFTEWSKWMLTNPDAWVASMLIALDPAGNWAGYTAMTRNSREPHLAHISFTGIERAHRGKQLALALKLMGLRFLKEQGITKLYTNNHSANAPMLAVNRKLGYVPLPGFFDCYRPTN